MMFVLAVIDMQAHYPAAQDQGLVGRIESMAKLIVRREGHCVAVSFDGCGTSTVSLPPGTKTVWKNEDDGGTHLYSYLLGAGLIMKDLRVIISGVNLSACVFSTACGLSKRLHDEHALSDNVIIMPSLCGDGARYKIRFKEEGDLIS